jgi:hypothetical protein
MREHKKFVNENGGFVFMKKNKNSHEKDDILTLQPEPADHKYKDRSVMHELGKTYLSTLRSTQSQKDKLKTSMILVPGKKRSYEDYLTPQRQGKEDVKADLEVDIEVQIKKIIDN